jgi:hypothetical protein
MAASHGFDASSGKPGEAKARVYQSPFAKANGGPKEPPPQILMSRPA